MNTIIGIPARGSGRGENKGMKKIRDALDRERLKKLADQLTDLVEELDDIREDLDEMHEELDKSFFSECEDDAGNETFDRFEEVCSAVNGAYQELNEALDKMEGLLEQ